MTLLLGTQTPHQIIVSADGSSTVSRKRAHNVIHHGFGRMTLQKIIQVNTKPVAIAHCGKNRLDFKSGSSKSIMAAIREWMTGDLPDQVEEMADNLEAHIQTILGQLKKPDELDGGFWICGFDPGREDPRFYELSHDGQWRKMAIQVCRIARGCGADFVLVTDWWDHHSTYQAAFAAQQAANVRCFGGDRHELVLRSDGSTSWNEQRCVGTLGLEDLLDPRGGDAGGIAHPLEEVKDLCENRLKEELRRRSKTKNGKRPNGIVGIEENWKGTFHPCWESVHGLVDIYDEACLADESDVSVEDARLYRAHINEVINSLPEPVD